MYIGNMHKKFRKDRSVVRRYSRGQTDTQIDILITILRNCSRRRGNKSNSNKRFE